MRGGGIVEKACTVITRRGGCVYAGSLARQPDHSGLIADLLELAPDVTIVASKVALAFLRDLVNRDFSSITVKSGDTLDLGGGHLLSFVSAPNLHWPDTMFTHDAATGILYTCDAFGAHYCTEDVWDSDLSKLAPHFRFYYDCLMRPNAKSVLTALRKVWKSCCR